MSNAAKITLECTSCGRKKRVLREPTDPPSLALMQTQCDRCNRGPVAPEYYFDAQGQEIDCDGELLSRLVVRSETAIAVMSIVALALLVCYVMTAG